MRLGALLFTLGYGGFMIGGLMLIPWGVSLLDPMFLDTGSFTIALMLTMFVSGALILTGFSTRRHKARGIELLLIMVLFWTVLPLPAALPFLSATQVDSLLAAYFEAVSALTTSGASVLTVPQAETAPILLWRALLNWLGGLWTLVFATAVLAPFGIGGMTLTGSPLLQHDEADAVTTRLGRPLRLIFPPYLLATAVGLLAMLLSGAGLVDSLCLTLSAISTGGMVTHSDSLADYLPYASQWVVTGLSFAGALSIPLLLAAIISLRGAEAFRDTEFRVFCVMIAGFTAVSLMSFPELASDGAVMQSISLHSTAGFNFLPGQEVADWPIIWTLVPLMIGGMAMSTAGGVKVLRAIILAKDLSSEVDRLTYPSSVHPMQISGRRLEEGDFTAAWSFAAVYILFVMLGVLLTGLFGTSLSDAWPLVLGALSNGLAITHHLDMPLSYATMSGGMQILLLLLMIAGRIELLILMVLFTPSFWRYMR